MTDSQGTLKDPCPYCNYELDDGDIYHKLRTNVFYLVKTDAEIKELAQQYGWTPENGKRFTKRVIVQPFDGPQYVMCPECKRHV